ncbi:MAG: hypothetical protein Sapg2KO_26860 [Saprospiraceae bacterium]
METEVFKNKIIDSVGKGADYEAIKKQLQAQRIPEESLKELLSFTDEMIYHRALQDGKRANALTQILMGFALFLVPILVANLAYDDGSKIKLIWYTVSLIGAWNIKEGWKKYRAPFEPPSNFGYSRKKFNRF